VVDPDLQPTLPGVRGELCIGGAGLARGYFGDPALTAARFVPNPFAKSPGERLYRTGDLARILPTGDIQYLGRVDDQVKVRGFRVELGEIEAALRSYDGVREAAALVVEGDAGEPSLVAYYEPDPARGVDETELRSFLRTRLPDFMLPSAVYALEGSPPRTPNGKLDRRALMQRSLPKRRRLLAPRNELEVRIHRIWSELLELEPIGVEQNFFELGGHSLLAARVILQLRVELELDIPLRTIFQNPTIEELSLSVEELLLAELEAMPDERGGASAQGDVALTLEET
jgi:acyl carrier protein